MTIYINPAHMTKEAFLQEHGRRMNYRPDVHRWDDYLAVCLVNNGPFTAAAIVTTPHELEHLLLPEPRPKTWYWVSIEKLRPYLPEDFK